MIHNGKEYKEIPGFLGYFVSEDGVVLSLRRTKELRWRKPQLGSNGYLELSLSLDGGSFYRTGIHRLVALAYIPCPGDPNVLVVNHKNGNKLDNRVTNLEWSTYQENVEHAGSIGITSKCCPVVVITRSSFEITRFPSIIACARTLGYTKDTVNWRVKTRGRVLHSDGLYYMFEQDVENFFKNLDKDSEEIVKLPGNKPVFLRDLNRGVVTTFNCLKDLAKHLNVSPPTISKWVRDNTQPVLPGLVQVKFTDDKNPWREVSDPVSELSKFLKTKVVCIKNKAGEMRIFTSAVECCKSMNITPTCLSYRLKSKGKKLFSDGYYYMYHEDTNSPVT